MIGIALDLRRPSHMTLDKNAGGRSPERHRAGEEERLAGDEILRLIDVGDDLFRRPIARRHAGQRHRSAHQLHEVAAIHPPLQRQRLLRKLLSHHFLEVVVARKLLERAPVFLVADPLLEVFDV